MTTARATGVLTACVYLGVSPTVEALQAHFKDGGRDMYLTALNELVEAGYVNRKTYRIGNRLQTECRVTSLAIEYLVGLGYPTLGSHNVEVGFPDLLFRQSQLTIHSKANKVISKEITGEPREEYMRVDEMGYDFFDKTASDEVAEERLVARTKHEQKVKAAYVEKKQEMKESRLNGRNSIPISAWSPAEIGHEFAYRVEFFWHIPPWQVTASRFIPALATMRKQHDTNGEIEHKMLDLFFEAIDSQKYDSAEHLWKYFIYRAPEFAIKAKHLLSSVDELEEASVQAKKSQEWLYE